MTPTPQERTELQRLAEAAKRGPGDTQERQAPVRAYLAAVRNPSVILNLLSLAAEREELRAENERLESEAEQWEASVDTLKEKLEEMTAQAGFAQFAGDAHQAAVQRVEALESRYSALEKAAQAYLDATYPIQPGYPAGLANELRRILSLPSPTEQGATE